MRSIDVASLLEPISDESPCGPDLEYAPDFIALEEAVRIEPEQQFGATIVAAEGPDWSEVLKLSLDVLAQSRDLRVAVFVLYAQLNGNGFDGLAQGLSLLRAYLERFWDCIHPQLDPDDDLDPTARVNIIASICDPDLVLHTLKFAPIIVSPKLSGISLQHFLVANGTVPKAAGGEDEALTLDTIVAACGDVDAEVLKSRLLCVDAVAADIAAIEQCLLEKVGVTDAISLDALARLVKEIKTFVAEMLGDRGSPIADDGAEVSTEAVAGTGARSESKRISGDITGPQDVTATLDKLIKYYERYEPSSPVPLLLHRAKRLVSLGFMDILRDLAPDALTQAETVTGASARPES